MRPFTLFALAVVLAACGISVSGFEAEPSPIGLGEEAGIAPADGGPITPEPDGGAGTSSGNASSSSGELPPDAGSDGSTAGCVVVLEDNFASPNLDERWRLSGSARHVAAENRVELTRQGEDYDVGVLWWEPTITWGSKLEIVFHYAQLAPESPSNLGVGIGIGWSTNDPSGATGGSSNGVGICGSDLTGVGAGLRLNFDRRLDAFTSIADSCGTNGGASSTLIEQGSGALTLTLRPGRIEARSAGVENGSDVTVSKSGYVGFSASTGDSQRSRFSITRAKVTSCP